MVVLAAALHAALGQTAPSAPRSLATLTSVAQILALSPEKAQASLPVHIQGMVTCYAPGMLLFVQDETAGVFVYCTGDQHPLEVGQYVEIAGHARLGRYSPIIDPESIQPLKTGPKLVPRQVSMAQVYLGGLDAQWVELTGMVHSQKLDHRQLELQLADPPYRLAVWLPNHGGREKRQLLGSLVRVRGVIGACMSGLGNLSAFQLIANAPADITVLTPGPAEPFSAPPCLARELRLHRGAHGVPGLTRARGVVTLYWPGSALFIQDSTGGLQIQPQQAPPDLVPGEVVEVAGFPGPVLDAPVLQNALVRRVGSNAPPESLPLSSEDLLQDTYDGQLVEIEARFLGRGNVASNRLALALQAGNSLVTALLERPQPRGALETFGRGSRLRVTGVRQRQAATGGPGVSLLLRSPRDIEVLSRSGLGETPSMQFAVAAALVMGVGLIVALWLIRRQRRRTEHMLELQAALRAEMRQSGEQLRNSIEDRERIARDLHDDIIQSIYAVGLNLEDCRRVVRQSPERAEPRLEAAVEALNSTIRHVRGFIAGLEPKVLNGSELKTALKSLALTSGDTPVHFQIDVSPAATNLLTSAQATQLLHVAKEAMSNSRRHAHASTIVVSLQPAPQGVSLEIRDDGAGFDPGAIGATGHGLRNMAARAREIGADLQLISTPGQGCRILVTVPQRNPHDLD